MCITESPNITSMFIDGTVASVVYFGLLSDKYVSFLAECDIPKNSVWFPKDDARFHRTNQITSIFSWRF
jgi:hypothetical protein